MSVPVWTPPTNVVTGQVEQADDFNALLGAGGDLDFLHTAKTARVRSSGNQSITTATFTALTFDTEDFDIWDLHESVTHPTRLTIPATLPGIWIVRATVTFAANATGMRAIEIRENGSQVISGPSACFALASGTTAIGVVTSFTFSAGDYVEALAYQDSGGALNATFGSALTFLEAVWQGSAT